MCDKPKEFSYGRCFSIIYRHGKTINDRMIRKFHLSGGQSRYLARICDNPGISQEELAQYYQIDKGAIAKSVRRMGELGYVKREQNPEDRRAYCLFPTEEIETFQRLLLRITDNMQKYIEEDKS